MSTVLAKGYKYTLVLASVTKRALAGEMPAEMRLQFLEHLEKMRDDFLSADALSLVQPIDNSGYEIVAEAMKLGPFKALDVYADKFDVFAGLNPSLLVAVEEAARKYGGIRSYAPVCST
jgi:hypothetical protein